MNKIQKHQAAEPLMQIAEAFRIKGQHAAAKQYATAARAAGYMTPDELQAHATRAHNIQAAAGFILIFTGAAVVIAARVGFFF
jgi:hypothetical protein